MPIHPKFAHLFLGGLSVRAAFSLIEGIVAAAPDDVRTGLKLLQEWIRAAVTQADGGTESLLHSALSCVPTQAETAQALEGWYYDLVEIHAPVVSAGTPSGGSVGGGGSRSAVPPPPNPTDATETRAPRFTTYYDDERIIMTWSRSTLRWSWPVRLAMVRLAGAEADQPSLRLRTQRMRLKHALHALPAAEGGEAPPQAPPEGGKAPLERYGRSCQFIRSSLISFSAVCPFARHSVS